MGSSISMKWSREDQDLQAWRETQPEKDSDLIRAALYALMEQRSRGGDEIASPTPAPPIIDMEKLKEIIDEAVDRGAATIGDKVAAKLSERLETVSIAVPLNGKKKKKEAEKPKIDDARLLEEALSGFDSWT